jgi:uncharacterized protein YndB with AHSA1/START domain
VCSGNRARLSEIDCNIRQAPGPYIPAHSASPKREVMGLLVLFVLLVVGVYAAYTPFSYSTTIRAPAATVFALIDDFHHWPLWSAQEHLDPAIERSYEGPARGKGARSSWNSTGRTGQGTLEIVESIPNTKVTVRTQHIRPGLGESINVFMLHESSNGTKVTWTSRAANQRIGRSVSAILSLLLNRTVQRTMRAFFPTRTRGDVSLMRNPIDDIFEGSLARLKAAAERGADWGATTS